MVLNVVIGLVAKPGGGKGTFKGLLDEVCRENSYTPSITRYTFSAPLRQTLQWYDILETRANLQKLSDCLDGLKPGALAAALRKMLEEDRFSDIRIADGVRWLYDETMIRMFNRGLIVYISANPEIRLQRVHLRKENVGDENKTLTEFLVEDNAGTERLVEEIGSRADFIIDNNGTLEDYKNQVRGFYKKYIQPARKQNPD